MQQVNPNAAWRDVARPTKIGFMTTHIVYPMMLWLLYMRYWTLGVVLITGLFFTILDYYRITATIFFRLIRSMLAGPRRTRRLWWL